MMFFENVKLLDCYIKNEYLQMLISLYASLNKYSPTHQKLLGNI